MIWFIWTGALMSVLDLKSSNFLCSNSLHRKIGYNKVKLCWKFEKPLACESQCIKHVEMVLLETSVCLFIANSNISANITWYPEKLIHFFFLSWMNQRSKLWKVFNTNKFRVDQKIYRDKQYRWFFYIDILYIYIYIYIYIYYTTYSTYCVIYIVSMFSIK